MLRIYKIPNEKMKEVKKIIEENPYAEDSFSKKGYVLREGKALKGDENAYYLIIEADEQFIKKADEKLKDLTTVLEGEEYEKIKKAYEEAENAAQAGFGALFG